MTNILAASVNKNIVNVGNLKSSFPFSGAGCMFNL